MAAQTVDDECLVGRRMHRRRSAGSPCEVRFESQPWKPSRILDLSREGFRLGWVPVCSIGDRIWVRIDGLQPLPATVRWKTNGGVGCEFSRPLCEADFDHFCRRPL